MKRRPPGDHVDYPVPGTRYRHPLYGKGHIFLRIDDDIAACGRPLLLDPLWWFESGWEDRLGSQYLIEDQRKGGECGDCKTKYEVHETLRQATRQADVFTKRERPEAIAARNVRIETMKAWQAHFERFWGEPTELILEA